VAYITHTTHKIINAEKYAKPEEVNTLERRTKIITEYRQPGEDGDVNEDNIASAPL